MNMFRILTFRVPNQRTPSKFANTLRIVNSFVSDTSTCGEIPKPVRKGETPEKLKARLLYQSRKRGMLENGLLLSTFADKYLDTLSPELMNQYDRLINEPSNDWDIYYWLTGKEEPPVEFKNEIFDLLQKHTQNKSLQQRYRQPDLRFQ